MKPIHIVPIAGILTLAGGFYLTLQNHPVVGVIAILFGLMATCVGATLLDN